MPRKGRVWSRVELLLALELYLDSGVRPDDADPAVQALAGELGRTPGSVALKLLNFRSIDSAGARGMPHGGRTDREVWENFHSDSEKLTEAIERDYPRFREGRATSQKGPASGRNPVLERIGEGDFSVDDQLSTQRRRRYQADLRDLVLEDYGGQCALCDVDLPDLLVASHIKPWSEDKANRLNPRNVIALCALHDRAFDRGLIVVREDGVVLLTPLAAESHEQTRQALMGQGRLRRPRKFFPDPSFLSWHRERNTVREWAHPRNQPKSLVR